MEFWHQSLLKCPLDKNNFFITLRLVLLTFFLLTSGGQLSLPVTFNFLLLIIYRTDYVYHI